MKFIVEYHIRKFLSRQVIPFGWNQFLIIQELSLAQQISVLLGCSSSPTNKEN
jgi:hypothetical protein